jgi:glutamine synthetase
VADTDDGPGTARMFCDITMPDGTPSWADPRHVLRRALGKAADAGFTFYTHPEIEFFLLDGIPPDRGVPKPVDSGGYFDLTPHDVSHDFRRQAITVLESMGISSSSATTRSRPASRRSTCATPTRCRRPTTS